MIPGPVLNLNRFPSKVHHIRLVSVVWVWKVLGPHCQRPMLGVANPLVWH